jgi:hypothetical protein
MYKNNILIMQNIKNDKITEIKKIITFQMLVELSRPPQHL